MGNRKRASRKRVRSAFGSIFSARFGGFTRSGDGASVVEFALTLPLLVAVLGGIIEFGSLFFLQNHMLNVAREEARSVAIGESSEAEAIKSAQAEFASWPAKFKIEVVDPSTTADPNDTDVVVTISVPIADAAVVQIWNSLKLGNLSTSVAMRSQAI